MTESAIPDLHVCKWSTLGCKQFRILWENWSLNDLFFQLCDVVKVSIIQKKVKLAQFDYKLEITAVVKKKDPSIFQATY